MGVGKVHGETEKCRNWAWIVEGSPDDPVSGTHPNQSTGAWRKKRGQQTGESQNLVSPFFPFSFAIKTKEKQFTTEDE